LVAATRPPVISARRRVEIPQRLDEATLSAAIARRLGSPDALPARFAAPGPVVWVDGADEVLVHLPSLRVALRDRLVAVSVDLETDQTGRETLVELLFATSPSGAVPISTHEISGVKTSKVFGPRPPPQWAMPGNK